LRARTGVNPRGIDFWRDKRWEHGACANILAAPGLFNRLVKRLNCVVE
jgi:hypothetical protein